MRGSRTKGAPLTLLVALLLSSLAAGTPPISEPVQGDEYVNRMKVAGTGIIDISTSVVDRRMALEYYNVLYGEGDFEMDHSNQVSQRAENLQGVVSGNSTTPVNLYETTRMTFLGETPLFGYKSVKSKAFWGGIGAEFQEVFAVTEMDWVQKTYFASTDPATNIRDAARAEELRKASPVHLVGFETKNSFNGTWQTDAAWHKIFYKDVRDHQAFSGKFEVEKMLKFHESPVADPLAGLCLGVDC